LGLLMAIYGPPFPNYRGGPLQRGRLTSEVYTLTFDVGNTWYDCLCILGIGQ